MLDTNYFNYEQTHVHVCLISIFSILIALLENNPDLPPFVSGERGGGGGRLGMRLIRTTILHVHVFVPVCTYVFIAHLFLSE